MVNLNVDGKTISAPEGQTLLRACLENGIHIPHICHLENDEHPPASCRICMVEVGGRPVPSCTVPVSEGLSVHTRTDRVRSLQRSALRLLLSNHRVECARCNANGHCALQNIAKFLEIGLNRGKLSDLMLNNIKEEHHPYLKYFPARCVLCGLCIRVCARTHGQPRLFFAGRGLCTHISFFGADQNTASLCKSCTCCADICPVGALEKISAARAGGKRQ